MLAPDRMVMGNRAAAANDRIGRRLLDPMPLRLQLAVSPQRMKREIGRRAVGIDMRETAGDLAGPAGRLADASLGRFLDGIVKRLEALPGDRRLKGVGDDDILADKSTRTATHPPRRIECQSWIVQPRLGPSAKFMRDACRQGKRDELDGPPDPEDDHTRA